MTIDKANFSIANSQSLKLGLQSSAKPNPPWRFFISGRAARNYYTWLNTQKDLIPMPTVKGCRSDEIEITPEMIEAGALAMSEYDPRFEDLECAVWNIYSAMEAANPKGKEAPEQTRKNLAES